MILVEQLWALYLEICRPGALEAGDLGSAGQDANVISIPAVGPISRDLQAWGSWDPWIRSLARMLT